MIGQGQNKTQVFTRKKRKGGPPPHGGPEKEGKEKRGKKEEG